IRWRVGGRSLTPPPDSPDRYPILPFQPDGKSMALGWDTLVVTLEQTINRLLEAGRDGLHEFLDQVLVVAAPFEFPHQGVEKLGFNVEIEPFFLGEGEDSFQDSLEFFDVLGPGQFSQFRITSRGKKGMDVLDYGFGESHRFTTIKPA
ncbi:MAG: hypothetical protein WAV07_18730, partial [Candidatus Contendobacter sp.]